MGEPVLYKGLYEKPGEQSSPAWTQYEYMKSTNICIGSSPVRIVNDLHKLPP